MRILLCLASATGGIGTHVADLTGALVAAGHQVQVATDPATRELFNLPGRATLSRMAVRSLANTADVVHAHGFRAALIAAAVTRRTPFVVSLHNPVRGASSSPRRIAGESVARLVLRRADLVTGASSDLVRDARALGARRAQLAEVPSPRVPALLATDRAHWRAEHRNDLLGAHGLDPARPLVLTIARVAPQKGIDVLADAAVGAPGQWALLGPGQEGLSVPSLHLLGATRDVSDWLLAADVLVVPSEWEARALVVQEAMAAGTPVVARRVGGLADLLAGVGLLVDGPQERSAEPLARAVIATLEHPHRAGAAAGRARERARGWDGLTASASGWVRMYASLQT